MWRVPSAANAHLNLIAIVILAADAKGTSDTPSEYIDFCDRARREFDCYDVRPVHDAVHPFPILSNITAPRWTFLCRLEDE